MQSPCLGDWQSLRWLGSSPSVGFFRRLPSPPANSLGFRRSDSGRRIDTIVCSSIKRKARNGERRAKTKHKENVWSIDNKMAMAEAQESLKRRRIKARRSKSARKRNRSPFVSPAPLMGIDTVLRTQEPVIRPLWSTFVCSVIGIWKGVGAVFSPITAWIEPIGIGSEDENLYDCYTLSCGEEVSPPSSSKGHSSQILRKINGVAFNPYGEVRQSSRGRRRIKEVGKVEEGSSTKEEPTFVMETKHTLPSYESFDFNASVVLDEDFMGMEPGLVFFEDGSYSRGPVDIPVGEYDESKYFLCPTFKFEQCLVKGCHKRLRIVHTIEFNEGGSYIQVNRVAVYEEQWSHPTMIQDKNDEEFQPKPFSQRKRTQLSDLTGSWKVFEVSAIPVGEEMTAEEGKLPYAYLCMETLKRRSSYENSVYFREEEMLDQEALAVLWLPGGVTAYVDVKKYGVLCIGVGWYSDEGINLVMERDYGSDGKLKEVRWKSEVKWLPDDPLPM